MTETALKPLTAEDLIDLGEAVAHDVSGYIEIVLGGDNYEHAMEIVNTIERGAHQVCDMARLRPRFALKYLGQHNSSVKRLVLRLTGLIGAHKCRTRGCIMYFIGPRHQKDCTSCLQRRQGL